MEAPRRTHSGGEGEGRPPHRHRLECITMESDTHSYSLNFQKKGRVRSTTIPTQRAGRPQGATDWGDWCSPPCCESKPHQSQGDPTSARAEDRSV